MYLLYCKNLWWPFGSHLIHTMYRKIYADMHGYKLLYTHNDHGAYSLYGGRLFELFASISDVIDADIIDLANKNCVNASNINHFLLKFSEDKKLLKNIPISYQDDIATARWHEFKPVHFGTTADYQASAMRKLAEPSDKIKNYLKDLPFIKEVEALNRDYIAVHIRWTDKVNGWCTESDFYDIDVYFNHALEIREKYGTNNIVLNCDNVEALNKFLNYNIDNNLNFNVCYDKEENLPINDWKECIFQKWVSANGKINADHLVKDLLNGFKIYKTIFEADSVVCNYFSNMALAPCVARNNKKDINISNKPSYALFPRKYCPEGTLSEAVMSKRKEGAEERKKLIETKKI